MMLRGSVLESMFVEFLSSHLGLDSILIKIQIIQ